MGMVTLTDTHLSPCFILMRDTVVKAFNEEDETEDEDGTDEAPAH